MNPPIVPAAIITESVTKRFRRSRAPWRPGAITAVEGVSLQVEPGTICGLVGPNGAGKTTLMRLVLGLLQPSAGRVLLLGEPHSRLGTQALRDVGALIEEPRFYPFMSGRENLVLIATLLGGDAAQTIDAALANVGLADRAGDRVKTYSLGMRQRLGLARCMLGNPRLLVLDEPTNGMDPQGISETRRLLRDYVVRTGAAVLLSSHLLEGVERVCDTIAFMNGGRIVRSGDLASLAGGEQAYRIGVDNPGEAAKALQEFATDAGWTLASCEQAGDTLTIAIDGEHDIAALNAALVGRGLRISELTPIAPTLEVEYLKTVGAEHSVRWSQ